MKLKKVVKNDICQCKSSCITIRQKKTLYKKHLLDLKYNVKLASNFNSILLDIPSSLILPVRNRGGRFYVTDKICSVYDKSYLPIIPWYEAVNKNK